MDRDLALVAGVALLCIRDARLIVSRPALLVPFVPLLLLAAGACGTLGENLSAPQAAELLGDPRLWVSAILLHGALAAWAVHKLRRTAIPDWLAVAPTPITCVGLTLGSRAALVHWDGGAGVVAGLALGSGYGLVVGLLAWACWQRRTGASALRFASLTHLTALLLMPPAALDSPLGTQPVDWLRTVLVLAAVVGLVIASFAWHRSRSR